jgi:hypothetical protein
MAGDLAAGGDERGRSGHGSSGTSQLGMKAARDESGVDNFRIRSYLNPNYADMEKSF